MQFLKFWYSKGENLEEFGEKKLDFPNKNKEGGRTNSCKI